MDPFTLEQSFNKPLPDLNLGAVPTNLSMGDGGQSTSKQVPPKIWIDVGPDGWSGVADEHVRCQRAELGASQIPATEIPFEIPMEADVSRATILYLTHPVNKTLEFIFGQSVRFSAEMSDTLKKATLRVDLVWFAHIGSNRQIIAILELKKRGMMRASDWRVAQATPKNMHNKIAALKDKIAALKDKIAALNDKSAALNDKSAALNENSATDNDTYFPSTSKKMMKQISAYATRHETRYVGLFDWNNLFLSYCSTADFTLREVGYYVEGTYLEDDSSPSTYRKVLLGWLICASVARGLAKENDPRFESARNLPAAAAAAAAATAATGPESIQP